MQQKLLFFDIDGTLVGFDGRIPDSTWTALEAARKKGHLLFICSGRNRHQIYRSLLDFNFDGIVGATGGYVEFRRKQLCYDTFGEEKMQSIIDCFKDTGAALILQQRDKTISNEQFEDQFIKIYKQKCELTRLSDLEAFQNLIYDDDVSAYPRRYADTASLLYCDSPYTTQEVRERMAPGIRIETASFKEPDPYTGEITLMSASKKTGIEKLLAHLGKSKKDVIAFGDSLNDVEMLEYADTSVVMGESIDQVKAYASYVTDDVKDDGIYNAMKHLELF